MTLHIQTNLNILGCICWCYYYIYSISAQIMDHTKFIKMGITKVLNEGCRQDLVKKKKAQLQNFVQNFQIPLNTENFWTR